MDFPAVLDLKWSSSLLLPGGRPVLASADARGRVSLLALDQDDEGKARLEEVASALAAGEEEGKALALSLDWSDRRGKGEDRRIAVSDSGGCLNALTVSERGGGLERMYRRKNHEFEVS